MICVGGEGGIYVEEEESIKGVNGEGKVINSVGCGDSSVGGMVGGLE